MTRVRAVLHGALVVFLAGSGTICADGPRVPIRATPHIAGQTVEAVVLLEQIDDVPNPGGGRRILPMRIPPGPFKPVAEDDDGYYFEASNTIQPYRTGQVDSMSLKTGLYISKNAPVIVFVYLGDPFRSHWLATDLPRLTPPQVSKLRLGKILRGNEEVGPVNPPAKKP